MDKNSTNGVIFRTAYDGNGKEYADSLLVAINVKEVTISKDLVVKDDTKSFPWVEKLIIEENVKVITISNDLFPNIKEVESRSNNFVSGPYLVRRGFSQYGTTIRKTLLNTFYKDETDVIDLSGINVIGSYAFYHCKCSTITNSERDINCESNAFTASALFSQPFVNGLKIAGGFVIEVEKGADVLLPDDDPEAFYGFSNEADLTVAKTFTIHDPKSLLWKIYNEATKLPDKVIVDGICKNINADDLRSLAHKNTYGSSVKHVSFTERCLGYKEIDGVIYDDKMEVLIVCSMDVESLIIPDGVKTIAREAFRYSNVKSVKFPDSLECIKKNAFSQCKNLSCIDFGHGIKVIGKGVFSGCAGLENVTLPNQIEIIGERAFSNAGLKSIKLNNGLRRIEKNAFCGTGITELDIPESVDYIGYDCYGSNIKKVWAKKYLQNIISFASCIKPFSYYGKDDMITFSLSGKNVVYIPRYIKPNMYDQFKKRIAHFFEDESEDDETPSLWDCAYTKETREDIAIYECSMNADNYFAKEYLRKNAKRVATRLMKEGDEEKAILFLKLGFVSKITLKKLLEIAEDTGQTTVKSYLLEQLGEKGVSKKNFYL